MNDQSQPVQPARWQAQAMHLAPGRLLRALRRRASLIVALLAILGAITYWGFIASDRYVSESHILIQRTDLASGQGMDIGSMLTGVGSGNRADQMLMRDYLLSTDMLNKLDAQLHLRAHYSDPQRDPLSRLWFADASQEWFHRYFLSRVSVEFDDYAGVLVIKAQGFDPKTAQAITTFLVQEGERAMNAMGHQLASEQVAFLEKQVNAMSRRALQARQAMLAYQNKKGLIAPDSTAQSLAAIVNQLEGQLAELQARRSAMLGYLVPDAPGIVELNLQIAAVEKQIASEKAKLTSPSGKALNRNVEEYQRLQLEAEFAQDTYKSALVALEKGRIEATRTLKKVSVLQTPTLPQYPLEPRRIYNIVVFVLVTLLLAGIAHLLAAIIRDHKD